MSSQPASNSPEAILTLAIKKLNSVRSRPPERSAEVLTQEEIDALGRLSADPSPYVPAVSIAQDGWDGQQLVGAETKSL